MFDYCTIALPNCQPSQCIHEHEHKFLSIIAVADLRQLIREDLLSNLPMQNI
jgi:hypothetical protein